MANCRLDWKFLAQLLGPFKAMTTQKTYAPPQRRPLINIPAQVSPFTTPAPHMLSVKVTNPARNNTTQAEVIAGKKNIYHMLRIC